MWVILSPTAQKETVSKEAVSFLLCRVRLRETARPTATGTASPNGKTSKWSCPLHRLMDRSLSQVTKSFENVPSGVLRV